jgi:hypothetical protein
MKFTFIKTDSDDTPYKYKSGTLTMITDAEQLSDVLQSFEQFLRGCGFYFDGHHLGFMEDEDSVGSDWWKGDPTCGGLKNDCK